jgi:hypothetical protein
VKALAFLARSSRTIAISTNPHPTSGQTCLTPVDTHVRRRRGSSRCHQKCKNSNVFGVFALLFVLPNRCPRLLLLVRIKSRFEVLKNARYIPFPRGLKLSLYPRSDLPSRRKHYSFQGVRTSHCSRIDRVTDVSLPVALMVRVEIAARFYPYPADILSRGPGKMSEGCWFQFSRPDIVKHCPQGLFRPPLSCNPGERNRASRRKEVHP